MNLRGFVVGLFRGFAAADGELDAVREVARQDARMVVGTYVEEFRAEAARVFQQGQQALIGCEEDAVDAEFTPVKQPRRKAKVKAKVKAKARR